MIFSLISCNKNKLYKILDDLSRDMANFEFLGNVLGVISPLHSVYYF